MASARHLRSELEQTNLSLCRSESMRRRRNQRNSRMMKIVKPVCILLGLAFPLSAYADSIAGMEISAAEQQACGPDVIKLCSDVFPDLSRVLGCMKSKRSQVSPACMKVARARGL